MKKIIISTLVGTVIFFAFQTIMWMGGIHSDFRSYSPNQTPIMDALNANLKEEGLYMLPMVDPASPTKKEDEEKIWNENSGKSWAMIFYHPSMSGMSMSYILIGILYSLIGCLVTAMIIFHGNFPTFTSRFYVSMGLSIFALCQGVLDEMNWWSYPWSFIRPQVIDLIIGWGICSLWFAWYLKKGE
jgi:hypothetical protein